MNSRYLTLSLAIGSAEPELIELEINFATIDSTGNVFLDQAWIIDTRHRRTDAPQWLYSLLQNSPAVADIIRREGAAIRSEWGCAGYDVGMAA